MTPTGFQTILGEHDRLALCGFVKSGKSLLLDHTKPDRLVFHTDTLGPSGLEWGEYPAHVIGKLGGEDRFLLVGMQAMRILRKGLEVTAVVWLNRALHSLTPKQLGFSRGARTMLHAWRKLHPSAQIHFCHSVKREETHC